MISVLQAVLRTQVLSPGDPTLGEADGEQASTEK
jgi:hypothetical protein